MGISKQKLYFVIFFCKKICYFQLFVVILQRQLKIYGVMKIFATTDRELEILLCALEKVGYTAESPAAVLHDRLYDIYLGRTNNEKIDYYDGI